MTATPGFGSGTAATSATVRRARRVSVCRGGFGSEALEPLPAALHAPSVEPRVPPARCRALRPTAGRQRQRAAVLVHLPEAAVRGRARRQPVEGAVLREILLGGRVVEGVDDRDGLAGAGGRARKRVGRLQVGRAVAGGSGGERAGVAL